MQNRQRLNQRFDFPEAFGPISTFKGSSANASSFGPKDSILSSRIDYESPHTLHLLLLLKPRFPLTPKSP